MLPRCVQVLAVVHAPTGVVRHVRSELTIEPTPGERLADGVKGWTQEHDGLELV